MSSQNFKNHAQIVPAFHYFFSVLALVAAVFSFLKLFRSYQTGLTGLLVPATLVLLTVAVLMAGFFSRSFALKAQDRAIRAEESLRYFAITGNLPDAKLTIKQFVALRFAPNNELVDLAHRAANENLSAKQIKEAIVHWRADEYRV